MKQEFSALVVKELQTLLKCHSLLTSLPTVRSIRIKRYWDKPVNMFRDGWRLCKGASKEGETSYIIGNQWACQRLTFNRDKNLVILHSYCRSESFQQLIFFDRKKQKVTRNSLTRIHGSFHVVEKKGHGARDIVPYSVREAC